MIKKLLTKGLIVVFLILSIYFIFGFDSKVFANNVININNLEVYIEIFKDQNGEYRKYKIIDKAYVNLTDYLSEMNLHYKE